MLKKAIYLLSAAFMLACLPCRAQEPSPLRFSETEWDFGTIREEDGPVTHVFNFTNNGIVPIAIDRVNASCGCTSPQYPRSLVEPGGRAEIKV